MNDFKAIVEMEVGDKVSDEEIVNAEIYARNKRYNIVKNEGDANGKRSKPYYLAKLTAETVLQNRAMDYCLLHNLQMNIKKDCAAH